MDDLPELTARMIGDLADLDAGEERLVALEAEVQAARGRFDAAAAELSAKRATAALIASGVFSIVIGVIRGDTNGIGNQNVSDKLYAF